MTKKSLNGSVDLPAKSGLIVHSHQYSENG